MKISEQQILEILPEIRRGVDLEAINKNIPLTKQGFDSLDMMNLYFQLEEKYQVEIRVDENTNTEEIASINQIINVCNTK